MNALAPLLQGFQASLMGGSTDAALAGAVQGRMEVYLNAYRGRLRQALADNFPVLLRALGDEAFDAMAWAYCASHPSRQRSIRWFGEHLPLFLQQQPQWLGHPALLDVARMDWALRNVFDAADAPALGLAELGQLAPAQWPELRLRCVPSAQVLRLHWAIAPLWQALIADADAQTEAPQAQPTAVLLWRGVQLDSLWRSLSPLEASALEQLLAAGELSFAALCQTLQDLGAADPALSAAQHLRQWVTEGVLAGPLQAPGD